MALPNEPITTREMYLSNIAGQNTALPDAPITREEMYLDYIAKSGGTGEGDMKKSIYDSDNSVASAGGIKMFVNQKIGTIPQKVGTLETKVSVLEGEVASIEDDLDNLGTASTKNSTSTVTESSDLVESGAVFDAIESAYQLVDDTVGWSGKNLLPNNLVSGTSSNGVVHTLNANGTISLSGTATSGIDSGLDIYDTSVSGQLVNGRRVILSKEDTTTGISVSMNAYNGNTFVKNLGVASGSNAKSEPFTVDYNGYNRIKVVTYILGGTDCSEKTLYPMIYDADVIDPAYEPYHASVEESLAEKADNSVIGTVEDGTNPTKSYAVGEHMVRGGKFCTVTSPVTTSSTWTLGSNYVEGDVANSLIKEATFSGTTSSIGTLIASTSNTMHLLSAEVEGCIVDLYKRSEGYGAVIKTPQGEVVAETAVSGKCYYISY